MLQQAREILQELHYRKSRRKIFDYFPDEGELRRDLYKKHMQFFALGETKKERAMIAANRIGKTETVGGYEAVMHLTGQYPWWWPGRRFDRPVEGWAAGDTALTVRDIIQSKLLGPPGIPGAEGTGLIPGDCIVDKTSKSGSVKNAVDMIFVRHISGGVSTIGLKSYKEGRKSFQGTAKDFIWLDEECEEDIYTECLLRTMTTGGMMMLTFTPLSGLSDVVLSFLPGGKVPDVEMESKGLVMATWDDVPHLSEEEKRILYAAIPPSQRDARAKGKPQLGSGAIYPIDEESITVADFPIPDHWPRCFYMDVGWNRTASLWFAWDRENDILYVIGEYYQAEQEPQMHSIGIKAKGEWIPGDIDPAARGRNQKDGTKLIQLYRECGLSIAGCVDNGVESGIYEVWGRFTSGRLKVFKSCGSFFDEFRIYRRDEKGQIVKKLDHLMDCLRYGVVNFKKIAVVKPPLIPNFINKRLLNIPGQGPGPMSA